VQGTIYVAMDTALLHVRVLRSFFQGEDKREAGVGAFEQGAPIYVIILSTIVAAGWLCSVSSRHPRLI
jgi:hypothetical protein